MQKKTRIRTAAGAMTALGILLVTFVGSWEGLRLQSYRDIVGVWTVCYGETKGVGPGMKFTKEECDEMFATSLQGYEEGIRRCLDDPDTIPEKTYISFISLAYNIGTHGFCKGSVPKLWNAGKHLAACNKLLAYNKAGGRVIKGLVNRRRAENKLCIEGLSEPVTLTNPADVPPDERPIIRRGHVGIWVKHLQTILKMNNVDGQFGPATQAAVFEFQKRNGLKIDGVVGPNTWSHLAKEEK